MVMITLYARQQKRHRCIEQYFFIHSSVNGHLGGLCVLAIVNSATMNIGVGAEAERTPCPRGGSQEELPHA